MIDNRLGERLAEALGLDLKQGITRITIDVAADSIPMVRITRCIADDAEGVRVTETINRTFYEMVREKAGSPPKP